MYETKDTLGLAQQKLISKAKPTGKREKKNPSVSPPLVPYELPNTCTHFREAELKKAQALGHTHLSHRTLL